MRTHSFSWETVSHWDKYNKYKYFLTNYQHLQFLRHQWLTIYKCSFYNFSILQISVERHPTKPLFSSAQTALRAKIILTTLIHSKIVAWLLGASNSTGIVSRFFPELWNSLDGSQEFNRVLMFQNIQVRSGRSADICCYEEQWIFMTEPNLRKYKIQCKLMTFHRGSNQTRLKYDC